MIISFSALFIMKRGISIENKLMLSYMVDEDEISNVASAVKRITAATVVIELSGRRFAVSVFFQEALCLQLKGFFIPFFHSVFSFLQRRFLLFIQTAWYHSENNSGVMLTVFIPDYCRRTGIFQ